LLSKILDLIAVPALSSGKTNVILHNNVIVFAKKSIQKIDYKYI